MKYETAHAEETDIAAGREMTFPDGLPGFPDRTRFAVISDEETWPFFHLQSLEDANLCLLTVDPFAFFPDYSIELPDAVVDALHITSPADVWVLSVVVIAEDFKQSTVNLQAPVVINHVKGLGRQVILNDPNYAVKQPLFSERAREGRTR